MGLRASEISQNIAFYTSIQHISCGFSNLVEQLNTVNFILVFLQISFLSDKIDTETVNKIVYVSIRFTREGFFLIADPCDAQLPPNLFDAKCNTIKYLKIFSRMHFQFYCKYYSNILQVA
jgi:hypothetical protein